MLQITEVHLSADGWTTNVLLRIEFLTALNMNNTIFWNVMSHSLVVYHRFEGKYCRHLQGLLLLDCSAYSSIQMIEVMYSPGMSVNLYKTTWRHIPKGSILQIVLRFTSVQIRVYLPPKLILYFRSENTFLFQRKMKLIL